MRPAPEQITAIVLAGGFGTRIRHLLNDLPKPMAPVAGKPFVEWVVRYLACQSLNRAVLSTGYLAETLEKHFAREQVHGIRVRCVPETTPLGTAGGFLNAAAAEKQPTAAWLCLNGDSLALAPLEPMFATLSDPSVDGAILGVPMQDAARYGTLVQNSAGELTGFCEKRPGVGVINAGVYLFRDTILRTFSPKRPLSFESDVFPLLAQRGVKIKVCVTEAPFLDIGTPESLPLADAFVRQHAGCFAT